MRQMGAGFLATISEAAPCSPLTVSAFASFRRPWAGPFRLAEPPVRAGWLAWRRLEVAGGPVGPRALSHAKARSHEVPASLTNTFI